MRLLGLWIVRAWMYRFGGIGSEAFTPRIIAMAIAAPNIRDQYIMVVPHCGHDRGFVSPTALRRDSQFKGCNRRLFLCSSNWRACGNALARTAVANSP